MDLGTPNATTIATLKAADKPKAKAKPKAKKTAPKKKTAKPKAKKPAAKKKTAKRSRVGKVFDRNAVARSERLDLRLTKAEKAKVTAKAAKTRRTVTSIVMEAIEKMK